MVRGIVFGGEGYFLSASLFAARAAGNPETSFVEMDFQCREATNSVYVAGCFMAGEFLLIDLLSLA